MPLKAYEEDKEGAEDEEEEEEEEGVEEAKRIKKCLCVLEPIDRRGGCLCPFTFSRRYIRLSIRPFVHPSLLPSACPSVRPLNRPSVHLFIVRPSTLCIFPSNVLAWNFQIFESLKGHKT